MSSLGLMNLTPFFSMNLTPFFSIEAAIGFWHKASETSRRLATIPGIGPIITSAIAAAAPDPAAEANGLCLPASAQALKYALEFAQFSAEKDHNNSNRALTAKDVS